MPSNSGIFRFCCSLQVFAAVLLAVGCGEPDIRTYTVPRIVSNVKPVAPVGPMMQTGTPGAAQRMLGGILLTGKQAWFFKVTADPELLEKQEPELKKWIESVRLDGEGNPTWKLPTDWRALEGNAFRFATIRMGSTEQAPELSVSQLPQGDDVDNYLLANLNRWRGQLQLPPWTVEEMRRDMQQLTAGEQKVYYVSLEGTSGGGGMTPPFAGGGAAPPRGTPPVGPAVAPNPADTIPEESGLSFDKPEAWEQVQPASSFTMLAFRAAEGETKLDVTVSQLGGDAGGMLPNVNRWRGQLQLPPIDEAQLATDLKDIPSELGKAKWVEIVDKSEPHRAIFAAIISGPEATWFVKAQGNAALADKQRQAVLDFVNSLKPGK